MKKITVSVLIIVFVVVIMQIVINSYGGNLKIKSFELSDYEDVLIEYSSDEILGEISDVEELLKKVEKLWINTYGNDIKKEKPYHIYFDEQENVWLVHGTCHETFGGYAYALIEDGTGKVLAVWHDK